MSARGALVVNEVCYDNSMVPDDTGDTSSDWIELYNTGPSAVNILNYGLGDANPYDDNKGAVAQLHHSARRIVVFASSDLPEYTVWTNAPTSSRYSANLAWRYNTPASAPPSTWKDSTFDDTAWASGIAPL